MFSKLYQLQYLFSARSLISKLAIAQILVADFNKIRPYKHIFKENPTVLQLSTVFIPRSYIFATHEISFLVTDYGF